MKIQSILQESIGDVLDAIEAQCESNKQQCSKYLATIMVLKDMGKLLNAEDHQLQKHTYIDYLYGPADQAVRALNFFHKRIQENPRARRLLGHYELQFNDHAYGHVVMKNRIESLRPYFNQRKLDRIKFHEERLINNLASAQDKIAADYKEQYDLSDGDKIYDDQASQRLPGGGTTIRGR